MNPPLRRFLLSASLLALAASARAANEPAIVTFRALVTDTAGVTRRWETYPLAAAYPDRYIDLAGAPELETLLKSHPALKFTDLSPKGLKCSEVPVGLGPIEFPPVEGTTPGVAPSRDLRLVVYITSSAVLELNVSPVGIPRPLPQADTPSGPSSDPLDTVRRSAATQLGASVEGVTLETYGEFDFNGDGPREMVIVAHIADPQRSGIRRSLLMVATKVQFSLPIYTVGLPPGSRVMGVGDLNGDALPEIVMKTGDSSRDFGMEIHTWKAGRFQRVFERRSYGCY